MCEFTQREYSCGHFRFIAARWCNSYKITHRRCQPDVTHFEFRQHEICGICQPSEMPPWFHSVKIASIVRPSMTTTMTTMTTPSLATLPAPKAASYPACPSSCSRRRRSLSNASPKSPKTANTANTAMTAKAAKAAKVKPPRPPIPLFSSTTALKSHRAV